jgi:hypothetical protein
MDRHAPRWKSTVRSSFKWKKTREVEEVTLIKIESEGAGQYCSELHKTPALACASEYGPKWQLFVPPDDPMILAHTYDLMLRRESFGSGSVYINPEAQICVRYCG